ncbi:MAG: nitroreductase [Oscillibacter sp.]|nr:nitroreductase [Oscillibacter sp.]
MNEVLNAIKTRRSIRKFKPDMPDKALVDQVVEAGLYAASGKNSQETIILVVTNRELIAKMSEDNRRIGGFPEGSDPFFGAPMLLVVLGKKSRSTYKYDGSLVMGNLMLAAHALGQGSCWIHRAREEFEMPEYQKLLRDLGVEGEWEGIGHCLLGYPDSEGVWLERKAGRVFYVK